MPGQLSLWTKQGNNPHRGNALEEAVGGVMFNPATINFVTNTPWITTSGTGIAQWLEGRIRDRKVAGSNPCRSGGRIFFSSVNVLYWLLFRYPFHSGVTALAHKRPRSFCRKWRWQVTAKYACTLSMWLCTKWHGAWLYGVHRTRRVGSSFTWHHPCQRCEYTTSVDIQKRAIKKLVTRVDRLRASVVSLL